jgi:hypothetical protein
MASRGELEHATSIMQALRPIKNKSIQKVFNEKPVNKTLHSRLNKMMLAVCKCRPENRNRSGDFDIMIGDQNGTLL